MYILVYICVYIHTCIYVSISIYKYISILIYKYKNTNTIRIQIFVSSFGKRILSEVVGMVFQSSKMKLAKVNNFQD